MEKVLTAAEQEAPWTAKLWHRGQADEAQLEETAGRPPPAGPAAKRARELLDNWAQARSKFVKVFPNEYKRALGEIKRTQSGRQVHRFCGRQLSADKT
jgi:glutamate synthase (NADPH/NADH) large chain/glutamate synthase (ferredoxin)